MLRPEAMTKISLIVRNDDAKAVIALLAKQKALHLVSHRRQNIGGHDIDVGTPMQDAAKTADALIKCNTILSRTHSAQTHTPKEVSQEEAIDQTLLMAKEFGEKENEIAEANTAISLIAKERDILSLLPANTPIEALTKTKNVKTFLLREGKKSNLDTLAKTSPLIVTRNEERKTILVTYSVEGAEENLASLTRAGFTSVDISSIKKREGIAGEVIAEMTKAESQEREKIQQAKTAQAKILEQRDRLLDARRVLSLSLLQMQAPTHFGTTKYTTSIEGYIPKKRMAKVEEEIVSLKIPLSIEKKETDDGPTHLHNAKPARPFEELVAMYTLPKYSEIDPTTIMAITFPLFFGFMLGDIGYGAVLLIAALIIRKKYLPLKGIATIVAISAVSSILFGIFFGEAFGAEELFGLHLTPVFHRAEDPTLLLSIAGIVGIVHVNIGLLLGTINESRHGILHGLAHKGGWFLLQIGAFLLLASAGMLKSILLLKNIPETYSLAGWTTLIIGILLILHAEHLHGLLELPMIFSHILSYLRLAAIGLASVALALVTNDLGSMAVAKGGLWAIMGVAIVLIGHTVNVLLGLLGPFLHSLRLHYAEFFMKFYEGGGKPYKPFGQIEENI